MGDVMKFPERIEDFIDDYSFRDDERTYTNGSMLIPVFRVKQAIEHYMPKWIPCSERLPSEADFIASNRRNKYSAEFVVMIEGATRPTTLYFRKTGSWVDENGNLYKVTAWQPLPEPYKGE